MLKQLPAGSLDVNSLMYHGKGFKKTWENTFLEANPMLNSAYLQLRINV